MAFFEFIVELIVEGLIEGLFKGLIKGLFRLIRKLGVLILKIITFNRTSFKKLDQEYYKDSSKPYFVVFFVIIGIVYLTQL